MRQIKLLLFYLVIANGFPGLWALLFPTSFYNSFPHLGLGLHWIDTMGPFNDHFIRDMVLSFVHLLPFQFIHYLDLKRERSV